MTAFRDDCNNLKKLTLENCHFKVTDDFPLTLDKLQISFCCFLCSFEVDPETLRCLTTLADTTRTKNIVINILI